ncbi:hypothetical protein L1049_012305 [Liquidambar formosana]|uniref:Uncharacterized protein n=1 Tax=Liquidambar formosana TaxID=63359 RepID=A0AAP0RZM3_LIQFO
MKKLVMIFEKKIGGEHGSIYRRIIVEISRISKLSYVSSGPRGRRRRRRRIATDRAVTVILAVVDDEEEEEEEEEEENNLHTWDMLMLSSSLLAMPLSWPPALITLKPPWKKLLLKC